MLQKKYKKNLVAIFAHPDDESFGPCGTLINFTKTHNVHIICATKGELGGKSKNIAQIRESELKMSAKIIGAKDVTFLGFKDGTLSNSVYHKLSNAIQKNINKLKPEIVVTYEVCGVSGHIDHIAVSLATTFVATKFKFIKKIMYYCIPEKEREAIKDYFIYFPKGYKKSNVDEVVNVEAVWNKKIRAIKAHKSQKSDIKTMLGILQKLPKEELFLINREK